MTPDEKQFTEKEVREREQFAFVHGWCASIPNGDAKEYAVRAYPIPPITRPRHVRYMDGPFQNEYRLVDDVLYTRPCTPCGYASRDDGWLPMSIAGFDEKVRVMLMDLFSNPTEEVHDD